MAFNVEGRVVRIKTTFIRMVVLCMTDMNTVKPCYSGLFGGNSSPDS
jgi:hypothetical protein